MRRNEILEELEPIGYKKLIEMYQIGGIPHFCWSYVSKKWEKREVHFEYRNLKVIIYPPNYQLPNNLFQHLEFALKHEGINLYVLKFVLLRVGEREILDYISQKPTGKYSRILWYFYEKFHNKKLPISNSTANYVTILDPQLYYCAESRKSPRHRILDNLLGSFEFSPFIRKTSILQECEKKQIAEKIKKITDNYDPSVLSRALRYLYTKETMASWEIEREKPDKAKLAKFVTLLSQADFIGELSKRTLVELQKKIVDPRFVIDSYRHFQNYVGEEPGLGKLIVHFIAPKPHDVPFLMEQLIRTFKKMESSKINPVIVAAILSFSFVFIHPFWDGNGRIHRFLIHYTLARLGFSPEGIIFPVSAMMLRNIRQYDKILESFSAPLMELISDYQVSENGEMVVYQDTLDYYRYVDYTLFAEYLYEHIEKTIETDFQEELDFLSEYDEIKKLCKEIVEMPDQQMDLFIRCVRQNDGKLSLRKRESHFNMLTYEEIEKMEKVINKISRQG